ncbi:Mucin-5B [Lignoscripta atroalba]|nr:Mucin-5B [Lignoscripta atroalba]
MFSRPDLSRLALLAFAATVWAQNSVNVPTDLSSGFDSGATELQVSYTGQAETGFADGARFTAQDTSKTPDFALGDASGVNTAITFLIMMVDTTTDVRVLHFLQTGFKADGDKTAISSSTQPLVPYQAPGTLGENGDRQYSFLLYQQKSGFQAKNLPRSGDTFDIQTFQRDNGLKSALAGVALVVNLAGTATTPTQKTAAATTTISKQQSATVTSAIVKLTTPVTSTLLEQTTAATSAIVEQTTAIIPNVIEQTTAATSTVIEQTTTLAAASYIYPTPSQASGPNISASEQEIPEASITELAPAAESSNPAGSDVALPTEITSALSTLALFTESPSAILPQSTTITPTAQAGISSSSATFVAATATANDAASSLRGSPVTLSLVLLVALWCCRS